MNPPTPPAGTLLVSRSILVLSALAICSGVCAAQEPEPGGSALPVRRGIRVLREKARASWGRAWKNANSGAHKSAAAEFSATAAVLGKLGEEDSRGWALNNAGFCLLRTGDTKNAFPAFIKAVDLARTVPDARLFARAEAGFEKTKTRLDVRWMLERLDAHVARLGDQDFWGRRYWTLHAQGIAQRGNIVDFARAYARRVTKLSASRLESRFAYARDTHALLREADPPAFSQQMDTATKQALKTLAISGDDDAMARMAADMALFNRRAGIEAAAHRFAEQAAGMALSLMPETRLRALIVFRWLKAEDGEDMNAPEKQPLNDEIARLKKQVAEKAAAGSSSAEIAEMPLWSASARKPQRDPMAVVMHLLRPAKTNDVVARTGNGETKVVLSIKPGWNAFRLGRAGATIFVRRGAVASMDRMIDLVRGGKPVEITAGGLVRLPPK